MKGIWVGVVSGEVNRLSVHVTLGVLQEGPHYFVTGSIEVR